MTLLSIVQNVAKEAGFSAPASVIGNSDDTAVLILALATRAGKLLARKTWEVLQKEYTFSTVASTASYAFPSDLGYFLDYTIWDRTQFWALRGSLSAQDWQTYKSGLQSTTPRQRFRIKGGLIFIDPTPSAVSSMVIEYLSNLWVAPAATPTVGSKTAFTVDTDVSLFDETAIEMDTLWRFLSRKGLAYAEEKQEALDHIAELFGNDAPRMPIDFGGDYDYPWPPLPTMPSTGYS